MLMFGVLLLFQVMSLPGQFRHMAQESPDMAYLRWPLTAVTVFWVLCVQVVIVAIWKLLTLVKKDRIFSEASLKWVDAIVWAIVGAALVTFVVAWGQRSRSSRACTVPRAACRRRAHSRMPSRGSAASRASAPARYDRNAAQHPT